MRGGLKRWRRSLLSFLKYTLRKISPRLFFKKNQHFCEGGLGGQYSALRFEQGGKGEVNLMLFMREFPQGADYVIYGMEKKFLKRSGLKIGLLGN